VNRQKSLFVTYLTNSYIVSNPVLVWRWLLWWKTTLESRIFISAQ